LIRRFKKRAIDAVAVLGCPYVRTPAKLALLWILMHRTRSANVKDVKIRVGDSQLSLKPNYYPDFATFRDIFLREVYFTDYHDAHVLDLGAHKGYFARYAILNGARYVHCFEPDLTNFSFLEHSLVNDLPTRATLWNEAIAACSGNTPFYVYDQSWSHSLTRRDDRALQHTENVTCRTLTDAIGLCDSDSRLIVKMDIEGAEWDSILGTSAAVLASVDELFIETHPFVEKRPEEIVDHLTRAGFTATATPDPDVYHFRRTKRAE
jgi:FkbM family methyltransferase